MTALDDLRWLTSEAAAPWLALAAAELSQRRTLGPAFQARLRKSLVAERGRLVAEQASLRERAREKFSQAARMFFTRQALEQATDEAIARYKANRFEAGSRVLDLCCGIGGDLIALGGRGSAEGWELQTETAHLAAANAAALQVSAEVVAGDVADAHVAAASAWHCDPDRRPTGARTTKIEFAAPAGDVIEALLEANPSAAIKVAPAGELPEHWRGRAEREWISSRGECRQQVLWFGELAEKPGLHTATVIDRAGQAHCLSGAPDKHWPMAGLPARYIYEPDAAVLAARIVGELCRQCGLAAVSPRAAYLTADELRTSTLWEAFEVLDVLPLDRKRLKAYCRERQLGRLEIKKRGVELDPEKLRKELAVSGDEEAVLIVAPVGEQVRAIMARRIRGG